MGDELSASNTAEMVTPPVADDELAELAPQRLLRSCISGVKNGPQHAPFLLDPSAHT